MTDPLGQSQVIPYLVGLSALGHQFHLISFEKEHRFVNRKAHIESVLQQHNITWHPISYTKRPPVFSTLYDIYRMWLKAKKLHRKLGFNVVHCRSYISSLVGLWLKRKERISFLFDMRGFWPEERVDGNLWNLDKPIYKSVYKFFKNKEIQFLEYSDAIISLTTKAKDEMLRLHPHIKDLSSKIKVIPCCADTSLFSTSNVNTVEVATHKKRLGLEEASPILVYLGSIGTWYMLDEMLDFFIELKKSRPNAKFVFITPDEPSLIKTKAVAKNIKEQDLRIFVAKREELPTLLAMADFSIFFIRPSYSKMASSPTKQGELMSMGIPIICNSGVGDSDYIVNKYRSGLLIPSFDIESYASCINQLDDLGSLDRLNIVNGAFEYFSLEKGVALYHQVYQFINKQG